MIRRVAIGEDPGDLSSIENATAIGPHPGQFVLGRLRVFGFARFSDLRGSRA